MAGSDLYNAPFTPPSTTIVSVGSDGIWVPGGTYDVTFRSYSVWYTLDYDFGTVEKWSYYLAPIRDFACASFYVLRPFQPNEGGLFKSEGYTKSYKGQPTPFGFPTKTSPDNSYLTDPTPLLEGTAWSKISQTEIYDSEFTWDADNSIEWVYRFTVPEDITTGAYTLLYMGHYTLSPDTEATITENRIFYREYYPLQIGAVGSSPPSDWPEERPDVSDEDDVWNPEPTTPPEDGTADWTSDPSDLTTIGGGRYNKQLVALGHRQIYFGAL